MPELKNGMRLYHGSYCEVAEPDLSSGQHLYRPVAAGKTEGSILFQDSQSFERPEI